MDEHVKTIVETIITHRQNMNGVRYYGGAANRIIAQIPKGITSEEELTNALEKAFDREEGCYL